MITKIRDFNGSFANKLFTDQFELICGELELSTNGNPDVICIFNEGRECCSIRLHVKHSISSQFKGDVNIISEFISDIAQIGAVITEDMQFWLITTIISNHLDAIAQLKARCQIERLSFIQLEATVVGKYDVVNLLQRIALSTDISTSSTHI